MPGSEARLYLITDRHQTGGRLLVEVVSAALEGGVRLVQLREKDLCSADLFRLAIELRRLTNLYGAHLLINDRIDIAQAAAADGVQLGISSLPVSAARRLLGPRMTIGYSAHGVDEARRAQGDGADFVTFGPVYATPSKALFGEPCGVAKLAEAVSALDIPVYALGGIKADNSTAVLAAGARGIAVISAILAAAEPQRDAASLLTKIEEYAHHT
ncbi:MAG TPA: thiamine phosphate synthase [Desulfuromonadales bacterium]|nr:thiamine phosphate synthase [Desulfuromonadales bacterium]